MPLDMPATDQIMIQRIDGTATIVAQLSEDKRMNWTYHHDPEGVPDYPNELSFGTRNAVSYYAANIEDFAGNDPLGLSVYVNNTPLLVQDLINPATSMQVSLAIETYGLRARPHRDAQCGG
jgi:hypothetical protein